MCQHHCGTGHTRPGMPSKHLVPIPGSGGGTHRRQECAVWIQDTSSVQDKRQSPRGVPWGLGNHLPVTIWYFQEVIPRYLSASSAAILFRLSTSGT